MYDKGSHFLVSHFLEWGVGLMGVGVGGGADGVRGCMSMNILFRSFCYWGHTFLVALFCANFL